MTKAEVQLWDTPIGEVAWDPARRVADFRYLDAFLDNPIEPSPIQLAKRRGIYRFDRLPEEAFQGLPGLLADALPDRYGHAVINRWLEAHGRPANSMNPVEKLLYIGRRAMGALSFAPPSRALEDDGRSIELDDLVALANTVLSQRRDAVRTLKAEPHYEDLISVGVSAGGARAKALVGFDPERRELRSGQIDLPEGFSHWLLKLDGVQRSGDHGVPDPQGYGRIEYAYSRMARAAGIDMPDTELLEDGPRRHFMVRRFDRPGGRERLHMQTLAALVHIDYNEPGLFSYEQALGVLRRLKCPAADQHEFLKRAYFNVLARNQDDHVKQVSFLMDRRGRWRLSPAYDLTYAWNPDGRWTSRHQMAIAGKLDDFEPADLARLGIAAEQSPSRVRRTLEDVAAAVDRWPKFAGEAGVEDKVAASIGRAHRRALFP
jgi:serine/threonine-protein kinase HipA